MGNHQMRRCAHCGSMITQAQVSGIQCLACGLNTDSQGRPHIDQEPPHVSVARPGYPDLVQHPGYSEEK